MQTTLERSDAQAELAKFFALTTELDKSLTMFSEFVDKAWHDLLDDPVSYESFCLEECGRVLSHIPSDPHSNPIVVVEWVGEYEERFGQLPPVWFADEHGVVQEDSYRDYLDSHTVVASWRCTPSTGSVATVAPIVR